MNAEFSALVKAVDAQRARVLGTLNAGVIFAKEQSRAAAEVESDANALLGRCEGDLRALPLHDRMRLRLQLAEILRDLKVCLRARAPIAPVRECALRIASWGVSVGVCRPCRPYALRSNRPSSS